MQLKVSPSEAVKPVSKEIGVLNLGKDYEQISKLLSISGNDTSTIISIPVLNDDLAEGLEIIGGKLEIISPPNNSTPSFISIEIIDNEGLNKP